MAEAVVLTGAVFAEAIEIRIPLTCKIVGGHPHRGGLKVSLRRRQQIKRALEDCLLGKFAVVCLIQSKGSIV